MQSSATPTRRLMMQTRIHALTQATPGTQRNLISLHFGDPLSGGKAYLQASLHADEPPGMLVAYHLRKALAELETQGRLRGEIVLVPMANPIGVSQRLLGEHLGRFALSNGENFNRNYADLSARAFELLQPSLAANTVPTVPDVRAALRQACTELPAATELESLRRCLLGLAVDADYVLDLHCDAEAVMHLYAATPQWSQVESLARALQAEVCLLATDSGDDPFDESCSMLWSRLNQRWKDVDPSSPGWPLACVAVTVELRGFADVGHALAQSDAAALIAALHHAGFIDGAPPALPNLLRPPRPLEGSIPVVAPRGGVLVHIATLGSEVRIGDCIAEVIDPLTHDVCPLTSPCDGVLYARASSRVIQAGTRIAKVAGTQAVRSGKLLSA